MISASPSDGSGEAARHGAKPGQPAAAHHPDQHGLGLIVERVRGEDAVRLGGARRLRQQPIARRARRFLQSGVGFLPRQRRVRCGTPSLRANALDRTRLAGRFATQAVIDGDGEQLAALS